MPNKEREAITMRLRVELAEFQEREKLYRIKREELKDLENMYRKKQDEIIGRNNQYKEKIQTNVHII